MCDKNEQLYAEIESIIEKATPGPWYGEENIGVYTDTDMKNAVFETGCGCCTSSTLTPGNAAFIAASRDLLPRLLTQVKGLEAERDAALRRAEAAENMLEGIESCLICMPGGDGCRAYGSRSCYRMRGPADGGKNED
jgi:hypothetical protein